MRYAAGIRLDSAQYLYDILKIMQMWSLQGKTLADVQNKLKTSYWPAMKMNWKVWTPIQFININYVPVQVGIRTLHQSSLPDCIRLLWSIIAFSFSLTLCTVPSAVCKPGCFILVCLSSLGQEMKPDTVGLGWIQCVPFKDCCASDMF